MEQKTRSLLRTLAQQRWPLMAAALMLSSIGVAAVSPLLAGASEPTPIPLPTGPSLTISPGVIMLEGQPGQSTTQDVTISNLTPRAFQFDLQAMDVTVRDGKRVFVPAGDMPRSIARTAVFSPDSLLVEAGESKTVHITVTLLDKPAARAIVAIFRSNTKIQGQDGLAMTASLGALMTFTFSKQFRMESAGLQVGGTAEGADLAISEWVTNTGSEPVVPSGVVAILDGDGKLVGKAPVEAMRLLPGERLQFKTEYPSALKAGKYRALMTLQHDSTVLTTASDFDIR